MWCPRSHVQLVEDSRTEQAHRAGHDGSLWQVPDLLFVPAESACNSRSGGASASSGPVGKLWIKKYQPRLRQEQRRRLLRLKGPFSVWWFSEMQWNPTSSCHFEPVASIVLRCWVVLCLTVRHGCGDRDFGYFLDCLWHACLLYDEKFDRCLATWPTDSSHASASAVSVP